MTVKFEPPDGFGTRVTINGAVARSKQPLATDPEHWTYALQIERQLHRHRLLWG